MTIADVELARLIYLASALGVVLFTSMLCRWLWRPLRFLLLAAVISLFFTPYYVDQPMPDGKKQNIVPAFVIMLYDVVNDRDHWRDAIKRAGKAIVTVGATLGALSLVLAVALPKPAKPTAPASGNTPETPAPNRKKKNPYLPEDFQGTA